MLLTTLILLFISINSCQNTDSINLDDGKKYADVINVVVNGDDEDGFSFSVTLSSPDTGCEQFADWWEVIAEGGKLLNRRILLHSHIQEQPFTRTGSVFQVDPDETIVIRGHMNNNGYGGQVLRGNINDGFESATFTDEFDELLSQTEPLPQGCTN